MSRFEELLLRCGLEKCYITITRFIIGLRENLKKELLYYSLDSLEHAYTRALEVEKYNKNLVVCCTSY